MRRVLLHILSVIILLCSHCLYAASAGDYYNAGQQHYQAGDYTKAAQYFAAAIKVDSGMVQAYYMLGNAHVKLGDKQSAATALAGYLRFKPGDAKVRSYLAELTGGAKPPPKPPAGSIVIFDDHFSMGVKIKTGEKVRAIVKEVRTDPAFGSHCLYFKADPKKKSTTLTIDWKGAWAAKGLSHSGDLSGFYEGGAIVFWVRGKQGNESFDLRLHNPPQPEYGGGSFSNTIPLAPYVASTTEWQKVIVPLREFRENGFFWGSLHGGEDTNHYRIFDWDQVMSLGFSATTKYITDKDADDDQRKVTVAPEFVVFLDQIMVVPSYSQQEYKALRARCQQVAYQKIGDGEGNIVLFDDDLRVRWWGAWPAPYSYATIDETTAKIGKRSFRLSLDPTRWSGSGCGMGYFDFTPFYKTGSLQFWIKGENGEENFKLGFDSINPKGHRVGTGVDIRGYLTVSTNWQQVKIPLVDFPLSTAGWPDYKMRKFNWAGVSMFDLSIAPTNEPEVVFWLDDVKVMTK